MKRVLMLVALISLAAAQRATAGPPERGQRRGTDEQRAGLTPARAKDAPRLLGEALRSGTADAETIATIVRWVLEEKEEKVAPGLASALRAAMDEGDARPADPRWTAAARSAVTLFEALLDDARTHRRRDAASLRGDLAPLVEAAAPAVAEALREVDAPIRDALLSTMKVFAPAAREVVPPLIEALRHAEPSVRLGAATALGALGREARTAIPQLRMALDDADAAVRAAAAAALEQVEGP